MVFLTIPHPTLPEPLQNTLCIVMNLRQINYGVEIETVKRTRERVARAVQSVVGGEVRHVRSPAGFDPWEITDEQGLTWKVVADGSLINVPGHLRAEVVSPVLAYADIPTLQEVIRAVRRESDDQEHRPRREAP